MSSVTETLHSEIYPALFEVLPQVLPEFGFIKIGNGYQSNNTRKLFGGEGESKGKVYVYERSPGYIKDYREGSLSIWDYIQHRDALSDNKDVFSRLAELAGITLSEQQFSAEDMDRIERSRRLASLWEAVNDFFIDCLSSEASEHAKTQKAKQVRDYLVSDRGYHPSLIRLTGQTLSRDIPKMELGYIPGLGVLADHLRNRSFAQEEINVVINAISKGGERVGNQNVLTFPYRDHFGRIKGMVFRSVVPTTEYKYLYSDFKRSEVLFNLKSVAKDKDLVIVESPLDAMHAAALGIKNITALGGSGDSLNKTQVDLAVKYGATKLTLLLDNDEAGLTGTDSAVRFLQKEYPALRVYIGQYPQGIKDLDELLVKQGIEGFGRVKEEAVASWRYQLDRLFLTYSQFDHLTDKRVDDLLADVVQLTQHINAVDKDLLIADFIADEGVRALGVTEYSISQTVEQIRSATFKKRQSDSLQSLLKEAKKVSDNGETSRALDLLKEQAIQIKSRDKVDGFTKYSSVHTEQQIKDRIRNRPEPLESGFTIDGDSILIPAAAISIVAGQTSHGKSVLLANLALNLANHYPDKTFHLFSYEVDQERYMINLLNSYIGDNKLAMNNRESIDHYFRGKTHITRKSGHSYPIFEPAKQPVFDQKRVQFFSELINTGRIKIHYVSEDSDALIEIIRHLSKNEPVGAVLIDYIQLIYTPVGKMRNPSRQEEIKQMCIDFKDIALETGLPLIFGAQFNREVTNLVQMHATKLGEAGDLERIADLIIGIWNNSRKWGKLTDSEKSIISDRLGILFQKGEEDPKPNPNTWYVEILKRRGGSVEVWDIWNYSANAAKVSSRN